jgi:hypothetical protein
VINSTTEYTNKVLCCLRGLNYISLLPSPFLKGQYLWWWDGDPWGVTPIQGLASGVTLVQLDLSEEVELVKWGEGWRGLATEGDTGTGNLSKGVTLVQGLAIRNDTGGQGPCPRKVKRDDLLEDVIHVMAKKTCLRGLHW